MSASTNGTGPLRQVLERAAAYSGCSMSALTVLCSQRDPYRLDTPAGHRDGTWFAEQVERFLEPGSRIHLRGLHYRISSAADVTRPDNGKPYTNTDDNWNLSETAAKAGRWLGYVPFERIVDERNAPAEIYVPEALEPYWILSQGLTIELPGSLSGALPEFICVNGFPARQTYRIILIGEKTSLREILLPISARVGAELLLPTGEASDTLISELAERVALDGRPAAVLYFSDFDPSGRQMATSVSRKLQALRDLHYPELTLELHPVALTLEQVRSWELPSTPLKETERRADKWRKAMGYDQVEIDSLISLNPDALREIAEEAIRPFFDETLARRVLAAQRQWEREAAALLEAHPAYQRARSEIEAALERVSEVVEAFHSTQAAARNILRAEVRPPAIVVPEAQIDAEASTPLFSTVSGYAAATRHLIAYKGLVET